MKHTSRIAAVLCTLLAMIAGLLSAPAQAAAPPKIRVTKVQAHVDDCTVDFSARITVKPTGKPVRYRWVAADGSKGPVKTLWRSRTVHDSQDFTDDVYGWQAVQVLSPRRFTSAKAYFRIAGCGQEPERRPYAQVSVSVDNDASVGTCDGKGHVLRFFGTVRVVDGPATVYYRWIRDGVVVDRGNLRVHDRARLRHDFFPTASGAGSVVLAISGPNRDADRVDYKVTCEAPAPGRLVELRGLAPKPEYGSCPTYVSFSVRVMAVTTGTVTFTYQAKLSQPGEQDTVFSPTTVTLKGAGEHQVVDLGTAAKAGKQATMTVTVSDPKPEAGFKVMDQTFTCP